MKAHRLFRTVALGLALGAAAMSSAWAQAASASAPAAPVEREATQLDRRTQRVDHIRVEDAGSRVDEVRAGGQTQSITVQPKAAVPAYDVQPADVTRPAAAESAPGSAGQRTWKVLSF